MTATPEPAAREETPEAFLDHLLEMPCAASCKDRAVEIVKARDAIRDAAAEERSAKITRDLDLAALYESYNDAMMRRLIANQNGQHDEATRHDAEARALCNAMVKIRSLGAGGSR